MSESPRRNKSKPSSPRRSQVEKIFSTKRQFKLFFQKLHGPSALGTEKEHNQTKSGKEEDKRQYKGISNEQHKIIVFPKQDYSTLPMQPLCPSLIEFYHLSRGRAMSMCVPASIIVTKEGKCYLVRSDEQGWVQTEPEFDTKDILGMMKEYFENSVSVSGDDQRYLIKSYESVTNSNLTLTYNNRYILNDEIKKLIGIEEFIIQKYITPRKKRPQIYRVDITRNGTIYVYKIKLKKAERLALGEEKPIALERKVSLRKLSERNTTLQLLSVKEDQVTKCCASSLNASGLKVKLMVGMRVSEVEKEASKIKDLYERYVFSPKAVRVTRFVVDFLPGNDTKLYFLQVKYYEGENKLAHDPKAFRKILLKKGLDTCGADCVGVFCKSLDGARILNELVQILISNGSISKKWSKTGTYLLPQKLIKDYERDMLKFESSSGEKNVLGPLITADCNTSTMTDPSMKVRSQSVCGEYEPQHVCELCHRMYKLYGSKKTVFCSPGLALRLQALSDRPFASWLPDDLKRVLDAYGNTLPTIKAAVSPSKRHHNYFYGYQSIVETPAQLQVQEFTLPSARGANKQDYVKLNMRSLSQPHQRKKNKITKFENSAAPKVTVPEDVLSLYKSAEQSQRDLLQRLKKSINKGYLN